MSVGSPGDRGARDAVIFDLDDTLYPERDYVLSGFQAVARQCCSELGISAEQAFAELRSLFAQGVRADTFNRWLAMHGRTEAPLVPRLVDVYRQHRPAIRPFPEIPALLARLRPRYRIGLLSDGYLGVQQRKFAALGCGGYFDAVVFSDTWGRSAWKPSAIPYEAAMRLLGVPPGAAVYVADNPRKDFLGARRSGMRSIRLRVPEGEYTALEPETAEHAPDHTVTSLAELGVILLAA
jgi:putative hydrolase of the HAD superfamily